MTALSTTTPARSFDQLIEWYARERDLTAARARWNGLSISPPHVLEDRLPEGFARRWECCRLPDQQVWARDDDLAVVAFHALDGGRPSGLVALEVWSDPVGFEGRLDALAQLEAAVA